MNGLLLAQNAGEAGGFLVGFGIVWINLAIGRSGRTRSGV
jgi:hypothetical protein